MSAKAKKSAPNGIWMCAIHGRIIDNDETTYSIDMLKAWKVLTEEKAALRLEHGESISFERLYDRFSLVPEHIRLLSAADSCSKVGNLFVNSLAELVWGVASRDIRDVVIEFAVNAFSHGHAGVVEVATGVSSIVLEDDGLPFNGWRELIAPGPCMSGWRGHWRHLVNTYGECLAFQYDRVGEKNRHTILLARAISDLKAVSDCVYEMPFEHLGQDCACDPIYLYVSRLIISNFRGYLAGILRSLSSSQEVVLVLASTSDFVEGAVRDRFPDLRIIRVKDDAAINN